MPMVGFARGFGAYSRFRVCFRVDDRIVEGYEGFRVLLEG